MKIIEQRFLDKSTRSVHASTIEFWNDHPVFSWFGGSREGAGDVAIFINNLNGEGRTISIGAMDMMPRWNPILFSNNGKLWLFEKAGQFCDRWQTYIHDITDWNETIKESEIRSKAQILPAGLNGPVKTKPISVYKDGDEHILCGSSVETFGDWTSYIEAYKIIDGKWEFAYRSNPIFVKDKVAYRNHMGRVSNSLGIIQPALWINEDGVNSFFRSSSGLSNVYYSKSETGEKVSDPIETNFLNPNSGVDVVNVNDRLFLVYNPSNEIRNPLVVDEIKFKCNGSWDVLDRVVVRESIDERHVGACFSQELSYPYMVENEGKLHLVYTYGRSEIEYCTINID